MGSGFGVQADSEPRPQLDGVGIFWACWTCIWTALLAAGMAYLVSRRQMPVLRIRGLALSLSAIGLLHLYWISVQIGYILAPLAPAVAEYWIMGIYLPFGIALFHASNSRFLHIAKAQKKYAQHGGRVVEGPASSRRGDGVVGRFRRLDYTSKVLIVVGLGMLFQVRQATRFPRFAPSASYIANRAAASCSSLSSCTSSRASGTARGVSRAPA